VAIREIRVVPDPVLRTPCDEIKEITPAVRRLVDDLLETVDDPGRAGLSANQIGVSLRAFSYNIDGKVGYVLNPVLEEKSGEQYGDEGCLSVPGLWYKTRRAEYARVRGIDLDGKEIVLEGTGIMGRMLQHECDHLDGHVYLDRLEKEERRAAMKYMREHQKGIVWFSESEALRSSWCWGGPLQPPSVSLRSTAPANGSILFSGHAILEFCVPPGNERSRWRSEPPIIVNRHTTNSRHARDGLCRSAASP